MAEVARAERAQSGSARGRLRRPAAPAGDAPEQQPAAGQAARRDVIAVGLGEDAERAVRGRVAGAQDRRFQAGSRAERAVAAVQPPGGPVRSVNAPPSEVEPVTSTLPSAVGAIARASDSGGRSLIAPPTCVRTTPPRP